MILNNSLFFFFLVGAVSKAKSTPSNWFSCSSSKRSPLHVNASKLFLFLSFCNVILVCALNYIEKFFHIFFAVLGFWHDLTYLALCTCVCLRFTKLILIAVPACGSTTAVSALYFHASSAISARWVCKFWDAPSPSPSPTPSPTSGSVSSTDDPASYKTWCRCHASIAGNSSARLSTKQTWHAYSLAASTKFTDLKQLCARLCWTWSPSFFII